MAISFIKLAFDPLLEPAHSLFDKHHTICTLYVYRAICAAREQGLDTVTLYLGIFWISCQSIGDMYSVLKVHRLSIAGSS